MTSDLQSAVELLRTNDYVSLIILTAILYDYVLMFSREVDYIWHKPWSWVSTMYVLVRYCGLSWAIFGGYLSGSSFVPGQLKLYASKFWLSVALITVHRCKLTNLLPSTISVS
jgi:ACR3 family arsenite efflux pump ArsB